jgi:hypothetical protein
MQAIRGSESGCPCPVFCCGRIFTVVTARAAHDSARQFPALPFPDESLRRDLAVTLGTFGKIQGLKMGFEALVTLAGCR